MDDKLQFIPENGDELILLPAKHPKYYKFEMIELHYPLTLSHHLVIMI